MDVVVRIHHIYSVPSTLLSPESPNHHPRRNSPPGPPISDCGTKNVSCEKMLSVASSPPRSLSNSDEDDDPDDTTDGEVAPEATDDADEDAYE